MTGDEETDALLRRASQGDQGAREELFGRYRARLERMIAVRLDRRVLGRLDASDVVQDVLLEANRRLQAYLGERPLPFYPWLRQIGWEMLVKLHRKHLQTQKRRVSRERHAFDFPDDSAVKLITRLAGRNSSVGHNLVREEMRRRVQDALAQLPERDREVLVLRHMEGLSVREIADVLLLNEGTVKTRHFRALSRLQSLLAVLEKEDSP